MANIFNKIDSLGLDYELNTKDYIWINHEKIEEHCKHLKGLHIFIPINDRFVISIIQQQNECTGEFYEDDEKWLWEFAIRDNDFKSLWPLDDPEAAGTVIQFLDEDEVIKFISKYYLELKNRK